MRVKASNSKAKPAPAVETSESINNQIAAFLKSGGEIQQIAKGVSGQTFGPSKQITLGKSKRAKPPTWSLSALPIKALGLEQATSPDTHSNHANRRTGLNP